MPVYEWQGFDVAGQCNGHRQGYPLVPFRSFDAKIPSFPSPFFYSLCSLQPLFQIKFPFLLKRTAKLSVRVSSSEENKYRSSFPSKSLSTYSASSFLRSLLLPKISLRLFHPLRIRTLPLRLPRLFNLFSSDIIIRACKVGKVAFFLFYPRPSKILSPINRLYPFRL